jgi:hypothetical protein
MEGNNHQSSPNFNQWTLDDYRGPESTGTSDFFKQMGEYATDVKFHHVHIPIFLNKIDQVAD